MPCNKLEKLLHTGKVAWPCICNCDMCIGYPQPVPAQFPWWLSSNTPVQSVYTAQHADQADKQQSITSTPPAAWGFEGPPLSGGLEDTVLCILAAKSTTAEMSVNKQAVYSLGS